ncbi:DUF4861 family protein [Brevundimonas sp. PAMC22021]|uniref:DUF4861 family protein n=1 Tax=Brevundimonas sp. PAMC22021 TaxID=2861285 RepID=UPI001C62B7CB|nr:DUF4861 family protein [Brevundimonas sp. PAMC22021]QYF87106.1 DUF4861 domain-containing protein [Brevundimonas sp. PAMC22021]
MPATPTVASPSTWYEQGDFAPVERVTLVIANDLAEDRKDAPVVVRRDQLPMLADIQELTVTLVDPAGEPRPEPSRELLARQGPHERRGESNGRALDYQFDDLDRDGVWDELFFVADLKAGERKAFHLYRGFQQRGWNPHRTHAAVGSYMRHTVPFWESEHVGWKLWFPTDIDIYAKRRPVLMAHRLYMGNLDGYGVGAENADYGADIMSVDDSFGGGGIGVFEGEALARPRFTPSSDLANRFNAGQQSDTRYSFDVLVNGPLRSMVRIRSLNWNTGQGRYEAEQIYTAYAGQNYTTAEVRFPTWLPGPQGADFAVGVRRRPGQTFERREANWIVTAAPEALRNPDDVEGLQQQAPILYAGTALIVPTEDAAAYQFIAERGGNHVFRVPAREDRRYRYMLVAGWSEGEVLKTPEAFADYVAANARAFSSPLRLDRVQEEVKR